MYCKYSVDSGKFWGFQHTSIKHIWSHMHFKMLQLVLYLLKDNVLRKVVKMGTNLWTFYYQNINLFKSLMQVPPDTSGCTVFYTYCCYIRQLIVICVSYDVSTYQNASRSLCGRSLSISSNCDAIYSTTCGFASVGIFDICLRQLAMHSQIVPMYKSTPCSYGCIFS